MKEFVVYKHTNLINNKVYIGITCQNPPSLRWGLNGCNYKNTRFGEAIKKYGWDNFSHDILFTNLTEEEACAKEIELIEFYDATNRLYGYNSTTGGETFTVTEEVKEKISKALMGNKNGLGKLCSEEKAKKISDAQKGKHLTEEHKKKLSEAKKGGTHKSLDENGRQNISNSDYHSSIKRKIYCEETNTIYESVHDCAKALGLNATNVSAVCRGKHKHTKGYHLRYVENNVI